MQKRSELFFNLIRLPLDFLAVLSGFVVAYLIRVQLEGRPVPYPTGGRVFLQFFLLVIPVWILIFAVTGLYGQTGQKARLAEVGKIFTAVSGGTMFLVLLDFLSTEPIFPAKAIIIYGYGLSFLFVVLERTILRSIQRWLYRFGIGSRRTIIAGTGAIAQQLAQDMAKAKGGYRLVAVVDAHPQGQKRMKYVPVYKTIAEAVAKVGEIDEIIQADSDLPEAEVLALVDYANQHQATYRYVPNNFGMYATQSTMQIMAGVPLLEVRRTPLEGWGRIFKRAFDLILVVPALFLLSPVFLIIGIVIKVTDPGPVFYKHKRLSRSGKDIYVYKFRSMLVKYSTGAGYSGKTDAEILAQEMGRPELVEEFKKAQKLNDDPRVSKIGKILRKTSLDELPQLINVLKGDMSLVGPRPIVLDEVEHYGAQAFKFFALKPGLVGLWQVSGRSDVDYDERVKLDIYYVENWSLWLDIKIIAKAFVTVLSGKGAY
jgi:exopolysaccharide biosynthesis polyprenyl glycosylphosphotransferase